MRIHFPLHYIRHGHIGGTENAAINLIDGLSRLPAADIRLHHAPGQVLAPELRELIADRPALRPAASPGGGVAARLPARFARFAHEARFARETSLAADATVFGNYTCPAARNPALGRRISIVHDLQHRVLPHYFRRDKRLWLEWVLRRTFARADEVIFISAAARAEARRFYAAHDRGNWRVVPNAVRWDDLEAPCDEPLPDGRYVLSASHQWPHKNLATLIEGFARLDAPDLRLVLTGQGAEVFAAAVAGAGGPLAGRVAELGLEGRVIFAGYVSRARLGQLYRHAALFAMPSLYEGFGLPPVEALGLGTPTLISGIPVLSEVTDGHAVRVEAHRDPAAWAAAMADVLAAPPDAAARARAAAAMRARYDPARVARLLLDASSAEMQRP